MFRPGIIGMRGSMVIRLRSFMIPSTPLMVTMNGGQVRTNCAGRRFQTPHEGDDRITFCVYTSIHMVKHPHTVYLLLSLLCFPLFVFIPFFVVGLLLLLPSLRSDRGSHNKRFSLPLLRSCLAIFFGRTFQTFLASSTRVGLPLSTLGALSS